MISKWLIIYIVILLIGAVGLLITFNNIKITTPDIVAVNYAVMSAMEHADNEQSIDIIMQRLQAEFENMNEAIYLSSVRLQIFLLIYIVILTIPGILFYFYCQKMIIKPFEKMKDFASQIAYGNLDVPLLMDKTNLFGAFTESFDLMREELKSAKENERKANLSKKELVASLSHDIKTPIASISAISELMLVLAKEEKEKKQLETIIFKADQINSLITNMFHSTLEELQEFKVSPSEIQSTDIIDLINKADYELKVRPFSIPECIVLLDKLRFSQVLDNIIGNSYKYAQTEIEINSFFNDIYLIVEIIDFGNGVSDDELVLLSQKYYRSKDHLNDAGYGLGLYISDYLLKEMGGGLMFDNIPNGFKAIISLKLA
jgi:signal transduction histidine kinase